MDIDKKNSFVNAIIRLTIKSVFIHPVNIELEYDNFPTESEIDDYGFDFEDSYGAGADKEFNEFFKSMTWDTILYPEVNSISIKSLTGGNDDVRGGGCGKRFPKASTFKYQKSCPKGVSVMDLTECVYRMKSCKNDYWYELLIDVNINIENEVLDVVVNFDHGS